MEPKAFDFSPFLCGEVLPKLSHFSMKGAVIIHSPLPLELSRVNLTSRLGVENISLEVEYPRVAYDSYSHLRIICFVLYHVILKPSKRRVSPSRIAFYIFLALWMPPPDFSYAFRRFHAYNISITSFLQKWGYFIIRNAFRKATKTSYDERALTFIIVSIPLS